MGKYEATIESYKKKLEDVGDVKRQLKLLEEKNTTLVQTNMDLEEDVKKTGNWKPQVRIRLSAYEVEGLPMEFTPPSKILGI